MPHRDDDNEQQEQRAETTERSHGKSIWCGRLLTN
jgi:hypothetical protein